MRHLLRRVSPVLLISAVIALVTVLSAQRQSATPPGAPPPIDPQTVQDQDAMTWADYKPIPGKDWADPGLKPERTLTLALVAIDFDDQPFVMTLPKKSDPFGNPQIDPIKREMPAPTSSRSTTGCCVSTRDTTRRPSGRNSAR